jgi:hypothetical protein
MMVVVPFEGGRVEVDGSVVTVTKSCTWTA